MTTDYKSTLYLPQTSFSMKAGLAKNEPLTLKRWDEADQYGRLREVAKGREKFVLHDGPPYANGHLHIGHALNKILKDVIVRSQQMMGRDSNYVPGWDCHGLPIEWKIEEKYRAEGKDKDEVPIVEFRKECREFAEHWIDIQREEFKRLGITGDWDTPYTTMAYAAEAQIVRELGKFLMDGSLYKGAKPVMWSIIERTALAEAEVEYHDHTSSTIFVRFPVVNSPVLELTGASVVIWTTTPWTIPGNRAVAYGKDVEYVALKVTDTGEIIVIAEALIAEVCEAAGISDHEIVHRLKGADLAGTVCKHPLSELDEYYTFDVPMLAADFVEIDTGSGFVHIAPGHGADDWELGIANGIPVPDTVDGDGSFFDHVGLFAGVNVMELGTKDKPWFPANKAVMAKLEESGALLASSKLVHSYPHSWRSKAPLIFRNTPQWFISMEKNGLRDKALAAIDETRFVPDTGRKRLAGMIETRPDWCVSRQRAWGVPITVFVNKKSGEPLRDEAVFERIIDAVEGEGADAWFASDASRFLGPDYDADDFDQVTDILDVWFDSGCTHSFVLEGRDDLKWPASLYLEGSDQHRGWFHSSLLESCGTRGRAPYDAVLTHGFVMAEDGHKMSKSLGNIVSPQDVVDVNGADILRLWVVGSDYSEDLRIGPDIIKSQTDIYRRLRNTLRFLLGNLAGFDESERLPIDEMPELERWVLNRLWQMDKMVRESCDAFHFHPLFTELHNFCAVDLSAFYLDIRKDSLYCDSVSSINRRAARTVLDELFNCLTAWLAPFICFTAEEAWRSRNPGEDESVHLCLFPEVPDDWRDDALSEKWQTIRNLRRVVTGAIEIERAEKRIRSSLQASPVIFADDQHKQAVDGLDLAELFITSDARFDDGTPEGTAFSLDDVPGVKVVAAAADGEKCGRCWKVADDIGANSSHPEICGRCGDAVSSQGAE
ncbi:MAG: isoleucine--tRNA ligase [Rhodospirillaceae bacterium]|jgi:isoleucyl-tRNA synthetase|nr:isoleucine--tRNA ligase [Rhodospirillaceae bacterium]MBT4463939.1 isoleucine--tRNA ligase [Rhodospirillaceae bacterium]MBT7356374.1 isoleucine--tRNA ligase [Rhodospirillaceae bacterium]